ncbi:MAG TPA: hypothetical protein VGB47_13055 [Thermoanaerobaculia bacterium]
MSTAPPIEPAPAGLPSNLGCWKGALLGCGAAAILVVAALVGLGVYIQKRPATVTDLLMERIHARYASDVAEPDKADLDAAYADFRKSLEDRRIRQEDMERVRDTVPLRGQVRREEVLELTKIFREAARGALPAASPGAVSGASPPAAATAVP